MGSHPLDGDKEYTLLLGLSTLAPKISFQTLVGSYTLTQNEHPSTVSGISLKQRSGIETPLLQGSGLQGSSLRLSG